MDGDRGCCRWSGEQGRRSGVDSGGVGCSSRGVLDQRNVQGASDDNQRQLRYEWGLYLGRMNQHR